MERHLLVTVSEKHDNLFGVRFLGSFFEEKKGMKVTLLYLTPRPPGRFEKDMDTEQRIKKSEAKGNKALRNAKSELLKTGFDEEQIKTKLRPARIGKVNEIIQEGSEGKYDAVVLGRRGLSRLEETFDESVSSTLFDQEWGFPLWICRNPDTKRKDVLACVDGSDASHRMLDHVGFILGQAIHQNVTLLTISKKGTVGDKDADEVLHDSKKALMEHHIAAERIDYQVIPETNAGKAILKEASTRHFAAVAVGRTGKAMGFLKKVFVGSVSRTLFQELEGASLWLA